MKAVNDKVLKLTPEQRKKVLESWKAVQSLPSASELMEARSSMLKADNTVIEDLFEELIPFSELKKHRKV